MKTKTNHSTSTRLTSGVRQRASIFIAALFCFTMLSSLALAQLSGTKNIPGDYPTLAAAITDDTQGVDGGVTLNLLAGNPETAPAGGYIIGGAGSMVLTTTSAANPVIIPGQRQHYYCIWCSGCGESERCHFQTDWRGLDHDRRFYDAGEPREYSQCGGHQQHD